MIKSELSFTYCCGDAFKKYYSKYMADIRKQVKKKNMKNLTIIVYEEPAIAKCKFSPWKSNAWKEDCICNKCYAMWKKRSKTFLDMNVTKCYIRVEG